MVQGDWNAEVGRDAQADCGDVCGPYWNADTNERGLRLLECATFNNLVLINTLGLHKPSRRWTLHSPDRRHHNQIDYILVRKRFQSSVNVHRTRSFSGADIGSDHDLVMMTFRVRLKKTKRPIPVKTLDGWHAILRPFSTVFQSYQDDGRLIMKGCVQWNSIYCWENFHSSEDRTRSARSVGQLLTQWVPGLRLSHFLFLEVLVDVVIFYWILYRVSREQTVTQFRRRVLWRLNWVCTVCFNTPKRVSSGPKKVKCTIFV